MIETSYIARYSGVGQFGPAYRYMLENDSHAAGSVDRVLQEGMIRICAETADYLYGAHTPLDIKYRKGSSPELEQCVSKASAGAERAEKAIERITAFTAGLQERVAGSGLDDLLLGGTEEEIISRGSDWCTDVARVGCVLCQTAGLPSRLVNLFDTAQAYSGHVVIETYRQERWGVIDTNTGVVYRHEDGRPASAWELMNEPELIESHACNPITAYTSTRGQFAGAAISHYFVWQSEMYSYAVSSLNDYYRSILSMAAEGWPGGLRWLHGEELL